MCLRIFKYGADVTVLSVMIGMYSLDSQHGNPVGILELLIIPEVRSLNKLRGELFLKQLIAISVKRETKILFSIYI